MTEPNTQRGWEERFSGQFLDGDDIRDCGKCMILVDEEFIDFFATELTKAREEGRNQEKTEVSEACKRLAGLADFNHVSDEMRSSATLYLLRSAEEDKSKYIKFLQEQPEQAIQSYRQELRTKVEQRREALKTKELRGDGILVLEDLLTIISE